MVPGFRQQNSMSATAESHTVLTMRRDAELVFRAQHQLAAAPYASLAVLCGGGEEDDVFVECVQSLPPAVQGERESNMPSSKGILPTRTATAAGRTLMFDM